MDTHHGQVSAIPIEHTHAVTRDTKELPSSSSYPVHAAPEVIGLGEGAEGERTTENADAIQRSNGGWFAYLKTKDFYLVLLLGYDTTKVPRFAHRSSIRC